MSRSSAQSNRNYPGLPQFNWCTQRRWLWALGVISILASNLLSAQNWTPFTRVSIGRAWVSGAPDIYNQELRTQLSGGLGFVRILDERWSLPICLEYAHHISKFDTPPPPTDLMDARFRAYKHDLTIRSIDLQTALRFQASKVNKAGWSVELGTAISFILLPSHMVHYIESFNGPVLGDRWLLHDGKADLDSESLGPIAIRPFIYVTRNLRLIHRSFSIGVKYSQDLAHLKYRVELHEVPKIFSIRRHDLSLSLRMNGFGHIP